MIILPALDLKDGKCVRLLRGEKHRQTVYSDDPVKMALKWQSQGAKYLHLIDLDGAFQGEPKNIEIIKNIRHKIQIPIELGGGIRNMGSIVKLLSLGLDRIILGTVAVSDPDLVKRAVERFGPEKIVVGIDARGERVAVKGWEELSEISALELALRMRQTGIERIIYTDISRDGTMAGPNTTIAKDLAQRSGLKVILSGGVCSLEDIMRVSQLERFGIEGVIVGKALYEGKVNLKEAIQAVC